MAEHADCAVEWLMNFHFFADDSQIYDHCLPSKADNVMWFIHWKDAFLSDIGHWMSVNHLKLNADKSELIWIGF